MSECSGAAVSGAVILEEPEASGASGGRGEGQAQDQGALRCVWPRQQTWLCVVPLLIGFIGLGLSLMLLKWIVVGTVRDYVPTDLVDANRIGQDPIFLSKPSGIPKGPDTTTTTTTPTVDGGNPSPRTVTVAKDVDPRAYYYRDDLHHTLHAYAQPPQTTPALWQGYRLVDTEYRPIGPGYCTF
ncbi:Pro-neuregulin-3, membrane-bound isoform [Larimichthys crocea]|uniref:Pro-neuregulin-3, membrane-bound isoform n=1 Tax=Larimichthys crocea TaxID=215358 RepID=A0A6G0HNR5_LARCR|nr:Pro-neuregulin-3, membrane-bound isoform [Larimichthys crocea]